MYKQILLLVVPVLMAVSGCNKDDNEVDKPTVSDEGELITTCQLLFTDTALVQPAVTATFRDTDGTGGAAPTSFDTIRLKSGTVYRAQIVLLNEAASPVDTISTEVLAEANEHLFCFTPSWSGLSIQRTDSDGVYEIGLQSLWTCGVAGNGTVKISLKHQPGVKNGSCDPGETDIELDFQVILE